MARLLNEPERELAVPSETCQVVVVCENLVAFWRVYPIVHRLRTRFAGDPAIEAGFWSFEDLESARKAESATQAAASADIVAVAATSAAALPTGVCAWLGNLAGRKINRPPVVTGFVASEELADTINSPLLGQLKRLTEGTGMEWLPVPDETEIAWEPVHSNSFAEPASKAGLMNDEDWMDQDVSHWGINE